MNANFNRSDFGSEFINQTNLSPQNQANTQDEVSEESIEELEESVSDVKDELNRLENRLTAVEDRLSTLKPDSKDGTFNPRMASFHHVYDPAHRTW